jgi:hypothetical protein
MVNSSLLDPPDAVRTSCCAGPASESDEVNLVRDFKEKNMKAAGRRLTIPALVQVVMEPSSARIAGRDALESSTQSRWLASRVRSHQISG